MIVVYLIHYCVLLKSSPRYTDTDNNGSHNGRDHSAISIKVKHIRCILVEMSFIPHLSHFQDDIGRVAPNFGSAIALADFAIGRMDQIFFSG